MFPAIFSALTRPTEFKLDHRVIVRTMPNANISPDSFVYAIMITIQRREGSLGEMGCTVQHCFYWLHIVTCSYGIKRVLLD